MVKKEKRKYPRLKDETISLKVKTEGIDIITKALDISAAGVYCKVENEIPLMSRIKIALVLPGSLSIETDGVVVREHPVIVDGKIIHYDVAIFFDSISEKQKDALLDYVNKKAEKK
ncbi:PilZ domain-containing protein [Candidatus Omnitrophota bacterium]